LSDAEAARAPLGAPPEKASDETPIEVDVAEDRYSRLRLIHWWDQDLLRRTRALVVGAGALGNEIVKNLALLGLGGIVLVDLDTIEDTNLARSVLFRASDIGHGKALSAAKMARQINPDVQIQPLRANAVHDIGTGVFADADIIFGALDNREARVAINQFAWHVGKPWIDGAIEVVQGVARMFVPPDGPCYECTMSEVDYKLLSQRRSCALLSREDVAEGKVPTTPTTASVIAGIQVQEAVKWLHRDRDLPVLAGKGFVFNGLTHDSYVIEYVRREDCPAHYTFPSLGSLDRGIYDTTPAELLAMAREKMGADAVVELERELIVGLRCAPCGRYEQRFARLSQITEDEAKCPKCGMIRDPEMTHAFYGHEDWLGKTLAEIGLPHYDVVTFRSGLEMEPYLLAKDRDLALGPVAKVG
jgi:adenylyltransferase/sulfurtransferase